MQLGVPHCYNQGVLECKQLIERDRNIIANRVNFCVCYLLQPGRHLEFKGREDGLQFISLSSIRTEL